MHGNGSSIPMGFPWEWGLDRKLDRNGNGNTTTWEWEWLMLVGSKNHSHSSVNNK